MSWSLGIVNGRLAGIFFDRRKDGAVRVKGHCYVTREEYPTKKEQRWIDEDCKHVRFVYRNKKYRKIEP